MSVYKTTKSRFWQYDFQYKGVRYHGSTKVETQRKAEAVERRLMTKVAMGEHIDARDEMTLDVAAGRWWSEVGQHKKSSHILEYRMGIVLRLIGPETPLIEIDTNKVSVAIERRRAETYARGFDVPSVGSKPAKRAERYALANDTVNSDIIKRLRPILNRAKKTWSVANLPVIDWESLALPEAETSIRHFSEPYQQAWMDECGPTEAYALELLFIYGFRFGELFFEPDAFKPDMPQGPCLALDRRKGKKTALLVPLRPVDARQIAARVGIAKAAKLNSIWLERDRKGDLVVVSYSAMQSRLRDAAERAGIDHARLIHSIRHHVGTDFLAQTGDLAATKELLGHRDIKSTLVYAHALDKGLRDAINSRNSPGAPELKSEKDLPNQGRRKL